MAVKSRLLSGSIKRRHGRIVLELAHGMRHERAVPVPGRHVYSQVGQPRSAAPS
jgi:hypothetical protein